MIIDHIDKLELANDKEELHYNELHSLNYLASGLWFLYGQIATIEIRVAERTPRNKRVFHFGNSPDLQGVPQDLVACAFHWYAVTVCNYVKMVGWIVNEGNSKKATDYLKQVIPPVKLWRDKVGAHFARHSPRDENAADLAKSVMFPIAFDDDAFYTDPFTLTVNTGARQSTSRQDMRWSLTHIHRDLIPRYWPTSTKEQG